MTKGNSLSKFVIGTATKSKQEAIREGIAIKLSIYTCEAAWGLLGAFRKQVYLDQALALMEYESSEGVVIKVDGIAVVLNEEWYARKNLPTPNAVAVEPLVEK